MEEPYFLVMRYNIAVLKGDNDQMDRVVALAKGKHGAEHWLAHEEALALARSGRLQAARRSSSRAVDLALQEGEREEAASYRAARAVWEAVYGNSAEGRRNAMAALELSKGRDVEYAAGFALALSGESSRSDALAGDLEKRFPEDTFAKFTYVPVLRALSALEAGKPANSVERLQIALQYELAANGLNFNHFYLGGLHSAYVRGEAFAARTGMRKRRPNFRRFSIIAASWGWIPSVRWRTCNSGECSLCQETRPRRGPLTWTSSSSGRTPTPTSRCSSKPKQNMPS